VDPVLVALLAGLVLAGTAIDRTRAVNRERQRAAVAAAKEFAEMRALTLPSAKPWDELDATERARLIRLCGGRA